MMRRRFFDELEAVASGKQPKALITDKDKNKDVYLPSACREEMINGMPREEQIKHPLLGPFLLDFIGQSGQPESVREAYEEAIGQKTQRAQYFVVHGANGDE